MTEKIIAERLGIPQKQINATLSLLHRGATIPFISRYRKEQTGGLDEVQIEKIKQVNTQLKEITLRKEVILKNITEQDALTPQLEERIKNCFDLITLEDIYLPYKPKRRTRAEIARNRGLEPLAKMLMAQNTRDISQVAQRFVSDEIENSNEALQGAKDIVAEWISEKERIRNLVRNEFAHTAIISSKIIKGKEVEGEKYKDYFKHSEPLKRAGTHRILAMRRAEKEGVLRVKIEIDDENCIEKLERILIKHGSTTHKELQQAIADSYKRLIKPTIETEFAKQSKQQADKDAIDVFAKNLQQLLLAPALGEKRTLGIDPGFKSGCKLVCLDAQGTLLHNETIYPHLSSNEEKKAMRKLQKIVEAYHIEAIAIGNGTASRETEKFVQKTAFDRKVMLFVVSENGASVYSASAVAREEFPQYDVTVRGAVSIARRLIDPLAELVKIDPKSIGVGQYQHDVDQTKLKEALDQTVENTVNKVGVNLNTASKHILTYIAGLGAQLAQNIVDYRKKNGEFVSRIALKKVPKIGDKTYEQCAGFLRIANAKNPLDNSAVHPESYPVVEKMAKDLQVSIEELINNKNLQKRIDLNRYITTKIGMPTLEDIKKELEKPGRDPRESIKSFEFDNTIKNIENIEVRMELPGIVTNITNFGVFCDIGIKENGLIHISNLTEGFVKNPSDVVALHQYVKVKVLKIDKERKRIQLKLI